MSLTKINPLISVVMTTFNHKKYIADSIQSVLSQSFTDFELVIVNDGSTDGTDEIIKNFLPNSKIHYISQLNHGPSFATNQGINGAKGRYIAFMSGDDICYPERLEKQYQYLQKTDSKVVFSWVDLIDEDGLLINSKPLKGLFNHQNQTRSEILNQLFFQGNHFCAVTALVDKEEIYNSQMFNLSSIQLQDFDMWIKLLKRNDISILPQILCKYRIRKNAGNLSNRVNALRINFEMRQIYKSIFDDVHPNLFKAAFSKYIRIQDFQDDIEYELEKSFLYLSHKLIFIRSIGVERLYTLLQDNKFLSVSKEKYSFDLPSLYDLTQNRKMVNSRELMGLKDIIYHAIYNFRRK